MNKYVKQLNDNSLVVQVVLNGSRLKAVDKDGNSHKVPGYRRQAAFDNNVCNFKTSLCILNNKS